MCKFHCCWSYEHKPGDLIRSWKNERALMVDDGDCGIDCTRGSEDVDPAGVLGQLMPGSAEKGVVNE